MEIKVNKKIKKIKTLIDSVVADIKFIFSFGPVIRVIELRDVETEVSSYSNQRICNIS